MYPFVEPKREDCRLRFKRIPGFKADDDGLYMDVWLPKTREIDALRINSQFHTDYRG